MKGLFESTKGVWSGDVDLNDGHLQQLYRQYESRCKFIEGVGVNEGAERLKSNLESAVNSTSEDLELCLRSNLSDSYVYT